jgi:hypothetical protein
MLGHVLFLLHSIPFIIHNHRALRRYASYVLEKASINIQRMKKFALYDTAVEKASLNIPRAISDPIKHLQFK